MACCEALRERKAVTDDRQRAECAIAIIDGELFLALREPGNPAQPVRLTPREADALAGRLLRAAGDLRAIEARRVDA